MPARLVRKLALQLVEAREARGFELATRDRGSNRAARLARVLAVAEATRAGQRFDAWLSYTVGSRTAPLFDDMGVFQREVQLSPWAFVFGPSITVGSIGVFL